METKSADGIVRGSYTYVDPEGKLQTVQYISDAFGFRVAGTNIPVHVVDQGGNLTDILEFWAVFLGNFWNIFT